MDKKSLAQRIGLINKDTNRLKNAISILEKSSNDDYLEASLDMANKAEKIACKLRQILLDLGVISKDELMEMVVNNHDIRVHRNGEILEITIPRLLPDTKSIHNTDFINQPLYYALNKFCKENRVEKFKECAVCFIHVYEKELLLSQARDYDNAETRRVLNTVSKYFLTDDSGRLCDMFHTTMYGETDCTRICIMPREMLPNFISSFEK